MATLSSLIGQVLLGAPALTRGLRPFARDRSAIFMLHRFSGDPDVRPGAHDPAGLRRLLEFIRGSGLRVLPVETLVSEWLARPEGEGFDVPTIAFTVDDGYEDFYANGLPVFEAYDCPVSCFVVPGVIDGETWFWWDKLEWILGKIPRGGVATSLLGESLRVAYNTREERRALQVTFTERLKLVTAEVRDDYLQDLAIAAGVELPARAPEPYQVMSWDRLREIERRGVTVGAHTMTHPILSRCDDVRSAYEIEESVRRVAANVSRPSTIFCYPNGQPGDFGPRETRVLERLQMAGALSAEPRSMRLTRRLEARERRRWQVPRVSFEERPGAIFSALWS